MPRRARFTIENGIYHVMVRGNNRANIFHDEEDFTKYMGIIKDNKERYGLKIYHYVLMNNHVHIIMKSPDGKRLSEAMRRIGVTYTRYYHNKYHRGGHLFQGRFKSFVIQEGVYLLECGRYIELNPVRSGIVDVPLNYRWSSYEVYINGSSDEIVDTDPEYKALSKKEERKRLYKEYVETMEIERRKEERFFKEGAYGTKEYIEGLRKVGLKSVWSHSGQPKKIKKT